VLDALRGRKGNENLDQIDPPDATSVKVGKYILLDTKTDGGKANICQQRAEEVLTKDPDVACLVGLWEYNPPAMLRAVKAAQNTKPAIIGFDENDETLDGIRKGMIHGTIVQDPYKFGYEAIALLAGLAAGKDVPKERKDMDAENRIFVPHRVIQKDNVDEFHKKLKEIRGK
jgi:ribose transport system substrate-binding protein